MEGMDETCHRRKAVAGKDSSRKFPLALRSGRAFHAARVAIASCGPARPDIQ